MGGLFVSGTEVDIVEDDTEFPHGSGPLSLRAKSREQVQADLEAGPSRQVAYYLFVRKFA